MAHSRQKTINCHTNATYSRTQITYAAETVTSDIKKEKEVGSWNQEVRQLIIKSGTNFLQSKIYLLQLKNRDKRHIFGNCLHKSVDICIYSYKITPQHRRKKIICIKPDLHELFCKLPKIYSSTVVNKPELSYHKWVLDLTLSNPKPFCLNYCLLPNESTFICRSKIMTFSPTVLSALATSIPHIVHSSLSWFHVLWHADEILYQKDHAFFNTAGSCYSVVSI